MKRFLLILYFLGIMSLQAQVGINTDMPNTSAALEIVSSEKGILIPRMTSAQRVAMANPAEGLIVYDTTLKCISQNAGTAANPEWICLSGENTQSGSCYMSSIAIDEPAVVTNRFLDLYDEYKRLFCTPTVSNTDAPSAISYTSDKQVCIIPMVCSPGAPPRISYVPSSCDLYYYVSYHDPSRITINSISADGIMDYSVKGKADYDDFFNIIFVVK
ncbi:hypothetical protein [Dysgonomonas macrotermitis]|uniref:Uncharacterized protein n=1 Tax=Dysgonomonas macrotermitis TaxID=1346286 RepID=A0A1M5JT22_9BACT|nr:hypothetical protein [Dysgonomonas macrotermitis]SHG43694.1 hypothetical protein SAMN05444362_1287 [Dysgonomonas macrotermitis]